MPIPLTRFNKITALHNELSNNSYVYNQYFLTCDLSDTFILDNNEIKPNKVYLNSRADYYIHPFSNIINCVTKFNNEKTLYKYKKPDVPSNNSPSSIDISSTQKIIQKKPHTLTAVKPNLW